ncbi:uncharacterized protein LOC114307209 isoform X1 [Camellia sinensis]|uniref:uncharacterized protein LOC114307209 isoform X1 n=1 Tax=Camellia sinensis TaxID=4442 RepID=UPI00103667F6|nr:uncharacterized protein LOC114307209 isoform X1 [Camellia sinensis]
MLVLVFINVSLRFYQEYGSSKAAMKLSEFVRCPVKVQRGAGRVVQTELCVRVDQRDVPGDIVIFVPGDLFPGVVRLLTSKHLVISQSSLTGEFGTTDIREDQSTPLLDLKNICLMGNLSKRSLHSNVEKFEFQVEVSRLMDIIINSLRSNKDIFLREYIWHGSEYICVRRTYFGMILRFV